MKKNKRYLKKLYKKFSIAAVWSFYLFAMYTLWVAGAAPAWILIFLPTIALVAELWVNALN